MAISYTPYDKNNQDFSDRAHLKAQEIIYPLLFQTYQSNLGFNALPEDQARTLDGDMGTDRLVEVTVSGLRAPLNFLVQERFRRPSIADRYDDITITEFNHNSKLPSELYKIKAGLFLYGKFDEHHDRFTEAIAFSVCPLLIGLARGDIPYRLQHNKKNQSFMCISTDDLHKQGIVHLHEKWRP